MKLSHPFWTLWDWFYTLQWLCMYWFLSIPIAVLCGQLRNSQSLSFGPTLSPPEQRWPPSTGHRLIASVISNSCYPTMNLIVHLFNPFLSSRSKRICLFCPPMDNSSITTYTLGHYIYWGLAKLFVKWRHRQIQLTWCSKPGAQNSPITSVNAWDSSMVSVC